jgi:hypothetical protein
VEPLVRDQKKAEILKPQIEEALRKHKDASALAKELNTLVTPLPDLILSEGNLTYVGQYVFLVGAAFGTPVGENTVVLIGTNGVYVIFVMTERTVNYPEDLMSKQIELRHRKVQTMAPEVEQELVRLGNVKDLRYKFS